MKWIFAVILFNVSNGLKILSILPFPQKSHHIVFNALLGALVERGHQVTVYSGHRIQTNSPNYIHHHIKTSIDHFVSATYNYEKMKLRFDVEEIFRPLRFQTDFSFLAKETLNHPAIRRLMLLNETFDVVLLETMFGQEALIGFGYRFEAPVVTMSAFGSHCVLDNFLGNPNPISYHAAFTNPYNSHMTFSQKVKTFLLYSSQMIYSHYWYIPRQQKVLEEYFEGTRQAPLPSLVALLTDTALVLLNTQPEVSHARALVPNMVNVGGLHIPEYPEQLPRDIKKFMDESSGVIYFSLGSTFSGGSIPVHILKIFTTVFENIPQRVLWMIDRPPQNVSANVKVVRWAPQNSILAHRACVAFITHGGLLSVLEAAHSAVPLIGIPLFADQGFNIAKVEEAQLGVQLHITTLSTSSLADALAQVLYNPIYKHNMKRVSASMRDRQESPLNTAVHWVEYVARHRGAPYLQSPARRINFIQYFMIDVLLFILVFMSGVCYICLRIFPIISRTCIIISEIAIAKRKLA